MLKRSLQISKCGMWFYYMRKTKFHTSMFPLYPRGDRDLPNPNLPTPVSKALGPDIDILHEQLQKCRSIEKLLEITDMHLSLMNSRHVATCFQSIHKFVKDDSAARRDLLENKTFQSLCTRLMKVMRYFESYEVLAIYKTLCELRIDSNTYIMQSALKMLSTHLNQMSIGQLVFLNFLLNKQRHSSLVDGLILALPLVLQVQIVQQLDSDNLTEIVDCLRIACKSRLKATVIERIIKVIVEKISTLSVTDAITVIFAMLNLETPVNGFKELRDSAFEIVCQNIEIVNDKNIISLLDICKRQNFFHSQFFYAAANQIVAKKWDFDSTYSAVSNFVVLEFAPNFLLDHFAESICLEHEQNRKNRFYSSLTCIEYLTATSYHSNYIHKAAELLYSDEKKLEYLLTQSPGLFVKFLSCLALLGHFPRNVLPKVLNEDFLFKVWLTSKKLGRSQEFERNVLLLSWAFEVYEDANFCVPSSVLHKLINSVYQKNANKEYPLTKFIENGIGGNQFVETGIFTQNGHVIDHIIAMQNESYPISLHKNSDTRTDKNLPTFIEDYKFSKDTKIVAILVAGEEDFYKDPDILRGYMDLKVRNLAKNNYSVVVVNYCLWKNLPDREKIPFLMQEIKNALQNNSLSNLQTIL